MPSGGYRPNAGRPKGAKTSSEKSADVKRAARKAKMDPLEYMLAVMNDPKADDARRDRMAIAAAAFVHGKAAETAVPGKKEQRRVAADEAASGKFAVPSPPKLVVNNR